MADLERTYLPRVYRDLRAEQPAVAAAYDALGHACREAGPLSERDQRLVKLGIAIGLLLSALATAALSGEGLRYAVSVGSLIGFTIVAVVAGVLAAIGPARRASRLDVLKALQYE